MSDQIETQMNINNADVGSKLASATAVAAAADAEVMRWEKFLPNMSLRVLLIDSDDSTRQIIAALLRKCSYRVASVPDGLKAWEVLKARSHNIDLILTEVDLPSISGFALLTLIMEHNICKNIPVIMMSSQHSVSMVYKCMLKGAVDFLVKPIRKNELRNLWQHVWRKQSINGGGPGPPEESVAHQNFEAVAKNKVVTSNPSSSSTACCQRNRECDDDQSSCANAQGADHGKKQSDINMQQKEGMNVEMERQDLNLDDQRRKGKMSVQTLGKSHALAHRSKVAMDLIGGFDNYQKCISGSSGFDANKIDPSPLFELSLRRSNASGSVKQDTLNPYFRLIYGASQQNDSTLASTSNHPKGFETGISFKNLSKHSGLMKPPTFCTSQMQSSGEASFQINTLNEQARNSEQYNCQEPKLEIEENHGYVSSDIDLNTYGFPVLNLTLESGKEEAFPTQREAALNKFRLKRKERCFDKKVRYESRKKLADNRPRVKGQFIRQGQNEPPADS